MVTFLTFRTPPIERNGTALQTLHCLGNRYETIDAPPNIAWSR